MNVSNSLSLLPKNPAHKIRFCERIVPAIVIYSNIFFIDKGCIKNNQTLAPKEM